jgi:hypothetical protein
MTMNAGSIPILAAVMSTLGVVSAVATSGQDKHTLKLSGHRRMGICPV